MLQIVFRFVVGGIVVSLFAALADTLKPKSFAGLSVRLLPWRLRRWGSALLPKVGIMQHWKLNP